MTVFVGSLKYSPVFTSHCCAFGKVCEEEGYSVEYIFSREYEWMLPKEIKDKTTFIGKTRNIPTMLKDTLGWETGGNGTNASGFSAIPGGYRYGATGEFFLFTSITYWWSSTENDADRGWYRRLDSSNGGIYRASTSKKGGKYIRCLKN